MKNTFFATGVEMLSRKISGLSFEFFVSEMSKILDNARGMSSIPGRENDRRGYLTLMDGISGEIIFTVPFGEIPKDKDEKYFKFSQEKAERLFSQVNMHLPSNHTSSFQSRNEEEEKYGGAIYFEFHTTVIILSFSGMPELVDEAMMLVLGDKIKRYIQKPLRKKIEACDRNPYFEKLLNRC
jgi:hypothetical protein